MKVCLVYADIGGVDYYGARKYYHGLGYLSSVLRKAGHTTALIYLDREPTADDLLQQLAALQPQVVAFSATTHQYPYVVRCAQWVKESMPEVLTVVGGTHPTLVPEEVVQNPVWDVVCVGEGEYALLDLVTALEADRDFADLPNLWLRRGDQIIRNPLRPLVANLDELPFPDRELFSFDDILAANDGWVDLMAGRGCPYNCSYCCNPGLREKFKGLGRYVRFRSVENVLAEIWTLAGRYRIKILNFQDDVFTLDRDWVLRFCELYAQEFVFPFWINTRVERINDEGIVVALARAGCQGVRIGIESGNEKLRFEILKRHMSNEEIRQAFALAHRYGLDVYTCNMLGIPGETAEMIEETIALNRQLEPAGLQFSVFYPYPMTELYDLCVREGYLAPDSPADPSSGSCHSYYERKSVLQLPTLSTAELEREYDRFQQLRLEVQMKKESPAKYRLYRVLLFVVGGRARWARAALRRLDRVGSRLTRVWRRTNAHEQKMDQVGKA